MLSRSGALGATLSKDTRSRATLSKATLNKATLSKATQVVIIRVLHQVSCDQSGWTSFATCTIFVLQPSA